MSTESLSMTFYKLTNLNKVISLSKDPMENLFIPPSTMDQKLNFNQIISNNSDPRLHTPLSITNKPSTFSLSGALNDPIENLFTPMVDGKPLPPNLNSVTSNNEIPTSNNADPRLLTPFSEQHKASSWQRVQTARVSPQTCKLWKKYAQKFMLRQFMAIKHHMSSSNDITSSQIPPSPISNNLPRSDENQGETGNYYSLPIQYSSRLSEKDIQIGSKFRLSHRDIETGDKQSKKCDQLTVVCSLATALRTSLISSQIDVITCQYDSTLLHDMSRNCLRYREENNGSYSSETSQNIPPKLNLNGTKLPYDDDFNSAQTAQSGNAAQSSRRSPSMKQATGSSRNAASSQGFFSKASLCSATDFS